jgi:TPP-dependent pyruvate/acetoin dehydrogenase alpha subunit
LGANGVVPDGVTIAVGAAHAIKLQKRPEIVVAFFGDGAMNRGPLFEAFNWAKLFDLPVLFVCEDNGYSVTLKTKDFTAGPPFIERAKSFGIPTHSINGNDVVTVANTAGPLVEAIRQGSGPQFLHATTYRWYGHLAHDKGLYRDPAEVLAAREDDCIRHAEDWLLEHGADAQELASLAKQADEEIQRAVKDALAAPLPDASTAWQDVQDIGSPSWA